MFLFTGDDPMVIETITVPYKDEEVELTCEFEVVDDEDFGSLVMLNSWSPQLDTRVPGWLSNATEQLTNIYC